MQDPTKKMEDWEKVFAGFNIFILSVGPLLLMFPLNLKHQPCAVAHRITCVCHFTCKCCCRCCFFKDAKEASQKLHQWGGVILFIGSPLCLMVTYIVLAVTRGPPKWSNAIVLGAIGLCLCLAITVFPFKFSWGSITDLEPKSHCCCIQLDQGTRTSPQIQHRQSDYAEGKEMPKVTRQKLEEIFGNRESFKFWDWIDEFIIKHELWWCTVEDFINYFENNYKDFLKKQIETELAQVHAGELVIKLIQEMRQAMRQTIGEDVMKYSAEDLILYKSVELKDFLLSDNIISSMQPKFQPIARERHNTDASEQLSNGQTYTDQIDETLY